MEVFAERYRPLKLLGEGAFGRVLRAEDLRLKRSVALKILAKLADHPQVQERFHREARVTAKLRHPHVIDVLDHGVTGDGTAYIVYEYVEGTDLQARIDQEPPPDRATAVRWARAIAEALAAAHEAGVLHRDLKPANILLRHGGHPLLADFGLARAEQDADTITQTGQVLGTPMYMSPEMWRGAIADEASDQFAWAAIFHQVLYGRHPYADGAGFISPDMLLQGRWKTPELPEKEGVPEPLRRALRRALCEKPGDRFRSMAELVEHLEAGAVSDALEALPEESSPRTGSLLPRFLAGGALAVMLALGLGNLPSPAPSSPASSAPSPAPEEPDARRQEIDKRLGKLLKGHLRESGAFFPAQDAHRVLVKPQLLDPLFPLQFRRILEALDLWLEGRPIRELRREGARRWLRGLQMGLGVHLLRDLGGLESAIASQMLAGGSETVARYRAERLAAMERLEECRTAVRDLLPRLERHHPDPPPGLFFFMGWLIRDGAPGQVLRWARATEARLDRTDWRGSLAELIELRGQMLSELRSLRDFGPGHQAILADAPRRFRLIRETMKPNVQYTYLSTGMRSLSESLAEPLREHRPPDLTSFDLHLDEAARLGDLSRPLMVRILEKIQGDLGAVVHEPSSPLGRRLERIEKLLAGDDSR